MNILQKIVAQKQEEVKSLYKSYNIEQIKEEALISNKSFYKILKDHSDKNTKFVISEFKRKSPSAGIINNSIDIDSQIKQYIDADYNAVSVLTDQHFFGGSYDDLQTAATILQTSDLLLLNKEFIIDPIQVYLARKFGANIILLISAILSTEKFRELKELAESLGMGVLAEIHNEQEYDNIAELNCTVIGINNRDLTRFKTSINNTNYLVKKLKLQDNYIIAESGMASDLDIRTVQQNADGYLIGTSLMQQENFDIKSPKQTFFKACGIRQFSKIELATVTADLLGFNFSLVSKRKIEFSELDNSDKSIFSKSVAVFYQNSEAEINEILDQYPFKYVQLYFGDVSMNYLKSLKQKVILAVKVSLLSNWKILEEYIQYTDLLILDGNVPGSGEEINENEIPLDFPYPFLLAGGININNIDKVLKFDNCIGIDVASGIETERKLDIDKIQSIYKAVQNLNK